MNKRSTAQTQKAISPTLVNSRILQRKCACGGSAGLDGKYAEYQKKRLLVS